MPAMRMRTALLFLFLLALPATARIDETVQEIQTRYGKALKGVKAEYPVTVAGLYQKNDFQITVGFYQGKSYYEQFQKIDPKTRTPSLPISQTEQEALLKANCSGCNWTGHVNQSFRFGEGTLSETVYDRSDNQAKAIYSEKTKTLSIRSVVVEKQDEENKKARETEEKKRQAENLKGF